MGNVIARNEVTKQSIKKSIQLTTTPFEELLENGEAIDFRLDEPQWADLDVGDIIEFWEDKSGWDKQPSPDSRKILVRIVDIFRAKSFVDIIDDPENAIFFDHHDKDDILASLRQWWTESREKHTGVLGLKVQLLPS